jgi:hypothetical protein
MDMGKPCCMIAEEACMLHTKTRFDRNPLFHFHPLQSLFSLIASLVLLGSAVWMVLNMR